MGVEYYLRGGILGGGAESVIGIIVKVYCDKLLYDEFVEQSQNMINRPSNTLGQVQKGRLSCCPLSVTQVY
jgi:hypothetical protein